MSSARSVATGLIVCLAILALSIYAPLSAAGQSVSGFYKVTATTDLGDQVRVTMQIRLVNASDDGIFVASARLRSLHPAPDASKSSSVVLQAHASAEFTQEFTVSRVEFEHWDKGQRPHLGLEVQVNGGAETTMTVALLPMPGAR